VITGHHAQAPRAITEALKKLDDLWITPAGDYLIDALQYYRTAREISLGYELHWRAPAPENWLVARKAWATEAKGIIKKSKADTELTAAKYAMTYGSKALIDWHRIKDTFGPETIIKIIDTGISEIIREWADIFKGLVWVDSPWLGEILATSTGLPFYRAGDDNILKASGPCLISTAHAEGKNLQQWHTNLVLAPPTSGKLWEQMLGRTHRYGQKSDTVFCDVLLHTRPLQDAFAKARKEAQYIQNSLGTRQKLCYADYVPRHYADYVTR
jgi:hypothetical protein